MRKHHPKNERIKRRYLHWLQETSRLSPHSIDQRVAAIALYESLTNYREFATFHIEQIRNFKARLAETINEATGKPLSKATIKSRLAALKSFWLWLADQADYSAKIKRSHAEYFNQPANDARIATAKRDKKAPTLEQVHHVIDTMPAGTPFELRSRAILALALLTGARDDAIASFSLRHVDLARHEVFQDAREVRTKFRKTFKTWFFPVGGQAEAILVEWVEYLRAQLRFEDKDPLFPPILMGLDELGRLAPIGFRREHLKDAAAIRKTFREAFTGAGLPYFNPHSIRTTLTQLGQRVCKTPEEFGAWSENLGHEDVLVTFRSYGGTTSERRAEIFARMRAGDTEVPDQSAIKSMEALLARLKAGELST